MRQQGFLCGGSPVEVDDIGQIPARMGGHMVEARKTLGEFLKRDSGQRNTLAKIAKHIAFLSPNFNHIVEGLRLAGMPEK